MSDEEPTITPSPYVGLNGQVKRSEITTTDAKPERTIEGGVSDERFETTILDDVVDKVNNARKAAIVTPYFLSFIWDAIMGKIFTNWKTTLGAIIALGVQVLPQLGAIDQNVANAITTIAFALGLVSAKDHNVTGGDVKQ